MNNIFHNTTFIGGTYVQAMLCLFCLLLISGCTGLPKGVKPADNISLNQYLGKWYEVARLDHSFERGLNNVTAEYSIRDDGGIKVINKGYSITKKDWKEVEGKAYFINEKDRGHLKVSFFGPFYSSYVIFELDNKNYQYAFIAGYNKSYLWLLSRTPKVSDDLIEKFIEKSNELGFNTDELIFVTHDMPTELPAQ